jgi:hypothetical protein
VTEKKQPRMLERRSNKKVVREFMDFDYLDQLTEEEFEFLNTFAREFYDNAFKDNGTDLHPPKTDDRRECYGRENARNRDMWNRFVRVGDDEDSE